MFKVNDYVVYMHETCKVVEIKNIRGNDYYVLVPINDNTLKISIPINNQNIKNVITKEEINNLISNISNIKELDLNDKNIENIYKELLNEEGYEGLIKIIKTTYLRNQNRINNKKKVSDKDDYYLNLAEKYLYSEMSITLNMSNEEVKEYLIKELEKI